MSKALNRLTSLIAATVLVVSFTACTDATPPDPAQPSGDVATEPSGGTSGDEVFDGEVSTETITANMMEMQIPTGLRIPESTLVTEALPNSIMMAEENPTAVRDMVLASAEEAGYEVHAEEGDSVVLVGEGNAVLFTAGPMVQTLTWGPESMKDALADALGDLAGPPE